MKEEEKKDIAFVRDDGWEYSKAGLDRLKESGMAGREILSNNIRKEIGDYKRLLRPLDKDAATIVKGVSGLVKRTLFLSSAICENKDLLFEEVEPPNHPVEPGEFMRLNITEEAAKVVEGMNNQNFRSFVSRAIRQQAAKSKA